MSKITPVLAILVLLQFSSKAQISKGNFIVGGNGSFSHNSNKFDGLLQSKDSRASLVPNLGFFLFNRFAAGVALQYDLYHQKYINNFGGNNSSQTSHYFGGGPFVRYYFLNSTAKVNILADARLAWLYNRYKSDVTDATTILNNYAYDFSAGPAFFINKTVALELLAGYQNRKYANYNHRVSGIQGRLGFQLHLD